MELNKRFTAFGQKSPTREGWTYVVMPGSAEYFDTRGLVEDAEACSKSGCSGEAD